MINTERFINLVYAVESQQQLINSRTDSLQDLSKEMMKDLIESKGNIDVQSYRKRAEVIAYDISDEIANLKQLKVELQKNG